MSFEEFVLARGPVLVRTAAALCRDVGLAEDLAQEVLVKVHQRWARIGSMEGRDSYVRRMLVNEFVSWRRKWARVVPTAWLPEGDRADPDLASRHADRQLLHTEILRLPRRQQVVLALRYYARLPDADIADALGCRVGTVRSLASRALATLRIDPQLQAEFSGRRPDLDHIEQGRAT